MGLFQETWKIDGLARMWGNDMVATQGIGSTAHGPVDWPATGQRRLQWYFECTYECDKKPICRLTSVNDILRGLDRTLSA